jgi:hypothetical protein
VLQDFVRTQKGGQTKDKSKIGFSVGKFLRWAEIISWCLLTAVGKAAADQLAGIFVAFPFQLLTLFVAVKGLKKNECELMTARIFLSNLTYSQSLQGMEEKHCLKQCVQKSWTVSGANV